MNKTQLNTPTDGFTPWKDHQGDLYQYNKTLKSLNDYRLSKPLLEDKKIVETNIPLNL